MNLTRLVFVTCSMLVAAFAQAGTTTVFKGGEWTCSAEARGEYEPGQNPFPDGDGYKLVYKWVGMTAEESTQVLTYKDGRELRMVRNNSGYHVNEGGTFKLIYDAAYADLDPITQDYSETKWHLAVGIASGRYIGVDFKCQGSAELIQKPYKRFSCETDTEIFDGEDKAKYKLTFAVSNFDDPSLVGVLSYNGSTEEDMPIRVKPMDYVVASLNETYRRMSPKNGDIVLQGDSDGVYWSELRLTKASKFTKGALSFEGEFRGGKRDDKMSVGVSCKVRNKAHQAQSSGQDKAAELFDGCQNCRRLLRPWWVDSVHLHGFFTLKFAKFRDVAQN